MTVRRTSCTILIGFLLAACRSAAGPVGPTGASAAIEAPPNRIVVLGDSLAVSPSREEAFPARLQDLIDRAGLDWTVANAGVSGDTTAGGLRRLPPLLTSDVGILIVALGANDGLRGVEIDRIEQNLSRIIELAHDKDIRVLLCGLETLPTAGFDYAIDFHRMYPRLRARHDVPLVPFLLAGVALIPDMNGPDRIHPNAAGAQRIANTVWPFLQPLLSNPNGVSNGVRS